MKTLVLIAVSNQKYNLRKKGVLILVMTAVLSIGLVGVGAADSHKDVTLDDGATHWVGQDINVDHTVSGGIESGEPVSDQSVTIRNDDDESSFAQEYTADGDGKFTIKTSQLGEGQYFFKYDYVDSSDASTSKTANVTFEVVEQDVNYEADESSVSNGGDNTGTTFELEDNNRGTYDVFLHEQADLTPDELVDVIGEDEFAGETLGKEGDFSGSSVSDLNSYYGVLTEDDLDSVLGSEGHDVEEDVVKIPGEEFDADFTDVDQNDYTFEFNVVDSDAQDTAELTVTDRDDAEVSFDESTFLDHVGNTANITFTAERTDTVDLHFGTEDIGYQSNITVELDDDEDEVTLEFNTTRAGLTDDMDDEDTDSESLVYDSAFSVHEDSDATITSEDQTMLVDPLVAESYRMDLESGSSSDVASLNLQERTTDSVKTHVAPENEAVDELEDVSDWTTESDDVSVDDKLVVQVESTGIFSDLHEDMEAADLAEGAELDNDGSGMYLKVEEAEPGPNSKAKEIDLATGDLIRDADNNTFYVVFNVNHEDDGGEWEEDNDYEAIFNVTQDNRYIDEDADDFDGDEDYEKVTSEFSVNEQEIEFDAANEDDLVELPNGEEVDVTGTTTIAPKSEIQLTVRSDSSTSYLETYRVEVTENRTFSQTYDLSDFEVGEEFLVETSRFDRLDGEIVQAGPSEYNMTVNVEDQDGNAVEDAVDVTVDGDTQAAPAEYTLTEGTYSVEADGEDYRATTEEVTLEEDTEHTVTVEEIVRHDLTVNVETEDGESVDATVTVDGEELSTMDGSATTTLEEGEYEVEASADGYVSETQSVSLTEGTSLNFEMVEEDDGDDSETTPTPTPTETEESPTQPGFGALLALVALMGAALLAQRRR